MADKDFFTDFAKLCGYLFHTVSRQKGRRILLEHIPRLCIA